MKVGDIWNVVRVANGWVVMPNGDRIDWAKMYIFLYPKDISSFILEHAEEKRAEP